MGEPWGIVNNNPLNIIATDINWFGEVPTDNRFEKFATMLDGISAGIQNIRTHYIRGSKTLYLLLHSWAPPLENDTRAYVHYVSSMAGIDPEMVFPFTRENVFKIVRAMIAQECGAKYFGAFDDLIKQAMERRAV